MAAISLHFHPGWAYGVGTVIDSIAEGGAYRSQWVTGTSNGGLTARAGGDRARWGSRLFAGEYDEVHAHERPVYGAWNRRDDAYGAAPRFGSAYFRLRPDVLSRATFCWPDSVYDPAAFGDAGSLDELCQLAEAGLRDRAALHESAAGLALDDPLNDYVEAHVHGELLIGRDVEALVVDPTDREEHAEALSLLTCAVEAHPGYRVTADMIDPAYRGEAPLELARRLDEVTPQRLAAAQRSGVHDPQATASGDQGEGAGEPELER